MNDAARTYRVLHDESDITQLGRGFYAARRLTDAAMERTLATVRRYVETCRQQDVEEIVVTGTSVIRDAANGEELLAAIEQEHGTSTEVISGEEEARLSFLAVRRDGVLRIPPEVRTVVADIGGGSTELIVGGDRIHQIASLDIGSVRLTETFLRDDPPASEQMSALRSHVRELLGHAPEPVEDSLLVGVGGTASALANIAAHRRTPIPDPHGYALTTAELADEIAQFARLTTAERQAIPGLEAQRAGVILAGALIVEQVMQHYGNDVLHASVRGLRYGLFYDHFLPDDGWSLAED
jgi:exopolyphosphatase/guanosine-5'-triphosphate,3'-diphosphate pyrophosphatase